MFSKFLSTNGTWSTLNKSDGQTLIHV